MTHRVLTKISGHCSSLASNTVVCMAKAMKKAKSGKSKKQLKKKLTPAQKAKRKADKAERQKKYEWIFINGKQVRKKRPSADEDCLTEEMLRNADPIWLHQNQLWEYIQPQRAVWDDDLPEDDRYDELIGDFWECPEPEWLPFEESEEELSARLAELDERELPF